MSENMTDYVSAAEDVLLTIGDWQIQNSAYSGWNSWVSHKCQPKYSGYMYYPNTVCRECNLPVPDDVLTVWTLHNFEAIGQFETESVWVQ